MKRIGKLELISFTTGFSLLTFELAAARVLAPSIGSSTYVWTSVIGVIIAALAGGFWIGGKLADRRNRPGDLAFLLLGASLAVIVTLLLYPALLGAIASTSGDVRLQAVIAALVLFAPASFLIGTTSPYLAKLNVRSLETTGRRIASLDAFNSIGGITGTFLTGFVLFGYVGSRQTFLIVALLLLAASWLVAPRYRKVGRMVMSAVVIVIGVLAIVQPRQDTVVIDTPSAHYEIKQYNYIDGTKIRGLTTGPGGIQSAVRLDGSSQPVFWYTKTMAVLTLERQPKRILILGGGAFTLPQFLAERLPESQIDVVEIDPALKHISTQYFNYQQPKNVRLIFTDARTFVNQSDEQYDVVLVDVYGDADIPFSLMTQEYAQAVGRQVAPGGILAANIIAGSTGPCKDVLQALHDAYSTVFSSAYYSNQSGLQERRANYVVLYSREPVRTPLMEPLRLNANQPYEDNFAPAERLYYDCQHS